MLLERGCIKDGKMGGQICKEGLPGFDEVFGSVVAVVVPFQITFCAEMHVNDFFLKKNKLFLTSAHQNDLKHTKHIKF